MNQHAAAQTFERNVPADLDLDMSQLTIVELVTAFEGLRTLSHVTSGILGQPRCRNGVEKLFNGLWERLNWEWDKAVKEVKARVPVNRDEKEARDYAIVANSIDQNSPIDECLADAALACKTVPDENSFSPAFTEDAADREWENTDRQSSPPKAYNLHDLHSDVHHLHELLGTVNDILHEMPYERDGKRDVELDRVSALNWIATDRCCQLADLIENHYVEIGTTCVGYRSAKAS